MRMIVMKGRKIREWPCPDARIKPASRKAITRFRNEKENCFCKQKIVEPAKKAVRGAMGPFRTQNATFSDCPAAQRPALPKTNRVTTAEVKSLGLKAAPKIPIIK
jgi:hypothetical protein